MTVGTLSHHPFSLFPFSPLVTVSGIVLKAKLTLEIKESLTRSFAWIWYWRAILRDGQAQTLGQKHPNHQLKGVWDRRDLAKLLVSDSRKLGLSRSTFVTPTRLAMPSSASFVVESVYVYSAVGVFGGWSHSVWLSSTTLTPRLTEPLENLALGITGKRKPSSMSRDDHWMAEWIWRHLK